MKVTQLVKCLVIRTQACSQPAVSLSTVAPVFLWESALSSISSKPSDLRLYLAAERNAALSIFPACLWLHMLCVIGHLVFFFVTSLMVNQQVPLTFVRANS